jgi:hypothetical protein
MNSASSAYPALSSSDELSDIFVEDVKKPKMLPELLLGATDFRSSELLCTGIMSCCINRLSKIDISD